MAIDFKGKLASGAYLEADQLAELLGEASAAWDDAGADRGPWRMEVDVADLAKLCQELTDRRAADA